MPSKVFSIENAALFLGELKADSKATESVIEVSKGCVNSNFDVVDVNMNISLWFSGEIVAGVWMNGWKRNENE